MMFVVERTAIPPSHPLSISLHALDPWLTPRCRSQKSLSTRCSRPDRRAGWRAKQPAVLEYSRIRKRRPRRSTPATPISPLVSCCLEDLSSIYSWWSDAYLTSPSSMALGKCGSWHLPPTSPHLSGRSGEVSACRSSRCIHQRDLQLGGRSAAIPAILSPTSNSDRACAQGRTGTSLDHNFRCITVVVARPRCTSTTRYRTAVQVP